MSTYEHQQTGPIVVAIGTDGGEAALTFAVEEARRTSRPVHVVHVVSLPAAGAFSDGYALAFDTATTTLEQALRAADELAGRDVDVTGELLDYTGVVGSLVTRSADAALLVLQHRHLSAVRRVLTGSVVNGVAARASVPVVSVPEGWLPRLHRTQTVTVAVQDPTEAGTLLSQAFSVARRRHATVVVLHAWWVPNAVDVVRDPGVRADWEQRARAELQPHVDSVRREYADVPVVVRVVHAPPAEALLEAASASDLLVIGRRHHRLPLGSHLGPIARAVVERSPVPVLVAPDTQVLQGQDQGPGEAVTIASEVRMPIGRG